MNNKAHLGLRRLFLKSSSIERIFPFEEVTDNFAKTENGRTLSPKFKRKTENPPTNNKIAANEITDFFLYPWK